MLDFLVGLSVISIYISIYGTLILLPLLRLLIVIINKTPKQDALKIVLIPLSIGYYMNIQKNKAAHYAYIVIEILLFVFALLGSVFLFYTRFA